MSCRGGLPAEIPDISASGPYTLSRKPSDELHPHGPGGEGDAGFACPDKGGGGWTAVMRFSKALVGPAVVLAPVNQAVIE